METPSIKMIVVMTVSLLPFFVGGFYIVLRMLRVKEKAWQRSLLLAAIFTSLLLVIGLILNVALPVLSAWSPLLSVIIFVAIIPKYLTLRPWQAVAIPFGVYMFGHLGIALTLMAIFNAFAVKQ